MAGIRTKRATLHDAAQLAGVSHMTVSRAIREPNSVRSSTLEKVRLAIRKLDYRPDPALSALAAYRSKEGGGQGSVLAFLDCDGTAYSQVVLQGVKEEARLLGYSVEVFKVRSVKKEQERLSRMLYHRGVRGLLFGPSDEPKTFSGWDWAQFAAVSLGALTHQPALHAVAPDYFQGAFSAIAKLKEEGCRRPGLVIDARLEARSGHRWLGGYQAGLGPQQKSEIYASTDWSTSKLRAWIKRGKIDGIMTIHGEVWKNLQASGIKMVLLNDQFQGSNLPRIKLDAGHIGAEGVRLLHHSMLRREFGLPIEPKMVALQGTWTCGS